jgi:hypothetical protein
LGKIGRDARAAVPDLEALRASPYTDVRAAAESALHKINSKGH